MFIKGKKKREELRLPILHYVVADDWVGKLGPKAFVGWLQFHTWCDRTDEARTKTDLDIIPMSLEKVAQKLDCSVSTLYRTFIRPLWEYGLIDLQEYGESNRDSQKPVNVIVYDYPQNNKELETKPLEKCRDWKTDYGSKAQIFALKLHKEAPFKNERVDPSKNERVDPIKNERVDPSKNERVTLSIIEGNNYTNNSINVSNGSTNDSNSLIIDEDNNPTSQYDMMLQYLLSKNMDELVAKSIVELAKQNNVICTEYEINQQIRDMLIATQIDGKQITNYPVYFLNGIVMQRQQRKTTRNLELLEEHSKTQIPQQNTVPKKVPFYNWLEERD